MSLVARRRLLLSWLARHDLRYVQAAAFAEKFEHSPRSIQRDLHALCASGLLAEVPPWTPRLISRERRSPNFCVTSKGWLDIPVRSRPRSVTLGHVGRQAVATGWQILTYAQDEPFAVDLIVAQGTRKYALIFDEPTAQGRHYSTAYIAAACRDVLGPAGVDVVALPPLASLESTPEGFLDSWPLDAWPLNE